MSHTYFFASFPGDDARAQILATAQALKAECNLHGRLIAAERLHVTLHFIGRYASARRDVEEQGRRAGERIRSMPFTLDFDRALSFIHGRRPSPCVLACSSECPSSSDIAAQLREATAGGVVAAVDSRPFRAHVTWMYSRDHLEVEVPVAPIAWIADAIALVHGISGQADYRILQRWTLGDG